MSTPYETDIERNLYKLGIPERMHGSIKRYLEAHVEPGDFLKAVLCNDLKEACARADDENIHLLARYVTFFYNYAPFHCWGSPQAYEAWIKARYPLRSVPCDHERDPR